MIFLWAIFGYLIIAIVFKWTNSSFVQGYPSLLLMLINMFLKFTSFPDTGATPPDDVLYGAADGSTQRGFQQFLVIMALLSVPVMLLVKPCVLKSRHKAKVAQFGEDYHLREEEASSGGHGHGGKFDFGELMVHQTIHTIEFCLGCISNTASYLRLWAFGACAVIRGIVGHGDETRFARRPCWALRILHRVGGAHRWCSADHGGLVCFFARAASALGGIPK